MPTATEFPLLLNSGTTLLLVAVVVFLIVALQRS
jgi:hypothetical protein